MKYILYILLKTFKVYYTSIRSARYVFVFLQSKFLKEKRSGFQSEFGVSIQWLEHDENTTKFDFDFGPFLITRWGPTAGVLAVEFNCGFWQTKKIWLFLQKANFMNSKKYNFLYLWDIHDNKIVRNISIRIYSRNLSNNKLRKKIIDLECENTLLNNQLQTLSVLEQNIFTLIEINQKLAEFNK